MLENLLYDKSSFAMSRLLRLIRMWFLARDALLTIFGKHQPCLLATSNLWFHGKLSTKPPHWPVGFAQALVKSQHSDKKPTINVCASLVFVQLIEGKEPAIFDRLEFCRRSRQLLVR
jgi:hypothetical protein